MQPLEADEPTSVGPYRLLGRLGSGGMGRVYLGRSAGGRTVAVKVVHPHFAHDQEFRARFRREVAAARRVGGAWTAPILDADPEAPVPWVASAYVAGPSLTAAVADTGPLPPHSVRALVAGLAEALAKVHELGLVHRDVKPSNVLLTLDGPLLIDFGIARATDATASLTSTGVSVGSPGYMAPEQILGKGVTGAADVFSLGAVLVYAATGNPPFPGEAAVELLYKVVHEEPELGGLEGDFRELAAACLAKDPAARPAPGDVARRLAPEGASRLVEAGWLPPRLVEQVSRRAVQLLNLETAADAGAKALEPASGPVGFSRAAAMGPTPTQPDVPPPSPPGTGNTPSQEPTASSLRPGWASAGTVTGQEEGRKEQDRRPRRGAVLAGVGALAVVTAGSLIWLLPFLGDGGKPGPSPTPTATSATPTASAASSSVPARYLGAWEGRGAALNGVFPTGTFHVTVKQAAVGEKVGEVRHTDPLGGVCVDALTLKQVTRKQLVLRAAGIKTNHAGCDQAPHIVRLTPVGDDLMYNSESSAAGRPEARLSRIEKP
ncbi:serine/threonine-protein kinase [Streptomyces thermoalcalitolerans]|uniref:Serine/threonine-protein kinase n=1 Tax=Streptomyces thermoalcalitolerans TaxID=65605 RepID=A0ABN1NFL6_9ACTN